MNKPLLAALLPIVGKSALVAGNVPRAIAGDAPLAVVEALFNDTMSALNALEREMQGEVFARISSVPRNEIEEVVELMESQMATFRLWVRLSVAAAGMVEKEVGGRPPEEEAPVPSSAPMGFGGFSLTPPAASTGRRIGFKPN